MRYFSSAVNAHAFHLAKRDMLNVGLSFGNVITLCGSFSAIFFSTLSLIVALSKETTEPDFSVDLFFVGIISSSSSSYSSSALFALLTGCLFFALFCELLFHHCTDIFGIEGNHTFREMKIQTNNQMVIATIIILIAPELASPNMFCNIRNNGRDAYHQYLRHCAILRREPSHVKSGKFRNAEIKIAHKTDCLRAFFSMPSLTSSPIQTMTNIPNKTLIHCFPIITEKTFCAISKIGDP
jgi:hypothetical protein